MVYTCMRSAAAAAAVDLKLVVSDHSHSRGLRTLHCYDLVQMASTFAIGILAWSSAYGAIIGQVCGQKYRFSIPGMTSDQD